MSYIGSWNIDDLLTFVVNTQVFATGVATDADSVPTYRVYEDETTTPILTGSMALLDSANTAGFYSEQITLSAANGFEKGKCYSIYITATVSSVAGATHRTFQVQAAVDTVSLAGVAVTAGAIPAAVAGAAGGLFIAGTNAATTVTTSFTTTFTGNLTGSVASVGAGGIVAATFAANALDAVWSTTTRLLTAGTNIVLVKGVGVTGFTDIDAAGVRGAVGLASANLDTQLLTIDTDVLSRLASAGYTVPPTANANADALLDRANALETGITVRMALRGYGSALLSKASGLGTVTATFRDINDTKDVIVATVDANGNRTAITLDLT